MQSQTWQGCRSGARRCGEERVEACGQVHEGCWIGVDEESKGAHVYWKDTCTVTVEQNIYFDRTLTSVSQLEGENWEINKLQTEQNTAAAAPNNTKTNRLNITATSQPQAPALAPTNPLTSAPGVNATTLELPSNTDSEMPR